MLRVALASLVMMIANGNMISLFLATYFLILFVFCFDHLIYFI